MKQTCKQINKRTISISKNDQELNYLMRKGYNLIYAIHYALHRYDFYYDSGETSVREFKSVYHVRIPE